MIGEFHPEYAVERVFDSRKPGGEAPAVLICFQNNRLIRDFINRSQTSQDADDVFVKKIGIKLPDRIFDLLLLIEAGNVLRPVNPVRA